MRRDGRLAGWIVLSALCVAISSCVHYHGQPLAPASSESTFRNRTLDDPGLAAFVRSAIPAQAKNWPPKELDLRAATAVAAYFNPEISLARSHLKTAEAAIVTAGGRPNPSFTGSAGYETLSSSPVVLRLELSLPLETAHKRSYRILEAAKLADAARLTLNETSWRVYSAVRDAWMNYIAAVEEAEAAARESQLQLSVVSLMQQRLSAGEISRPEWDQVRIEASRAAIRLNAIHGQVSQSRIALASAMGVPEAAIANVQFSKSSYNRPELIDQLPPGSVQKAGLLNRLDIQRSLLEYAAADAQLHLEIARQYPDIQLNPGYDFDEGIHKFTFGTSFPIPVWNRNRGPIAEAESRRSAAEAEFLALQQKAIHQVEQALELYRTAVSEFQEADVRWKTLQTDRERSLIRAVDVGEADRLALNMTRLQSVEAERGRLQALGKTRAAFSALEDAVQAPLDDVPWIQPRPEFHADGPAPK
ncbi:MAG TPA: TolC family protein [Bryobacteraceae bacterium]|nr:TolC family protein [Bryobacteraceae bacterium]